MLAFSTVSQAQQYQFVYLQTDNKQPFYVRVNDKLYSSSAAGYLVIPKLTSGTYQLAIGFPKSEWPVQNITVPVAGEDLGFLLKNFDTGNWGLFNLHTMEVVSAAGGKPATATPADTKTDQFSNILADVVNSPSIKQTQPDDKQPAKPVAVAQERTVATEPQTQEVPVVKKEVAAAEIEKLSSVSDKDGVALVYVDRRADKADTIKVFIEGTTSLSLATNAQPVVAAAVTDQPVIKPTAKEPATEERGAPKFIDITLVNPNDVNSTQTRAKENTTAGALNDNKASTEVLKPLTINSDCKQLASESDFLKIRKKMTSENKDDEMVKAALKLFKQKCYSTDQVKNLSVLFLNDEGKYKLFDAAYPYVHDTQHFKQLESQLSDPYIVTRFRAMIRN